MQPAPPSPPWASPSPPGAPPTAAGPSVAAAAAVASVSPRVAGSRRAALKSGFLFKQSAGPWKRRRWHQRWFVLDCEAGVLKHFRHASPVEAVPFRADAHGELALRQPGASLVIQGDLPRGAPSPFCFTVAAAGGRQLRICANSSADFRDWTGALLAVLGPRRPTSSSPVGDALASPPLSPQRLAVDPVAPPGDASETHSAPVERLAASRALGDRSTRRQDTSAVQVAGKVRLSGGRELAVRYLCLTLTDRDGCGQVRELVGEGTAVLIALNPLIGTRRCLCAAATVSRLPTLTATPP